MRRQIKWSLLILAGSLLARQATAQVVAGPVVNPSNNHSYYLLAPASWTNSEAQAVALGGHLATINDQTEQDWVVANFSSYAGVNRELWIGFRSTTTAVPASAFSWVSGEPTTYTNWAAPEPNDPFPLEGLSLYVRVYSPDHGQYPGQWDNWPNDHDLAGCPGCPNPSGVVEVPQAANTVIFNFVGYQESWVVPGGVTSITVDARGAQGGGNGDIPTAQGGKGGRVQTTLAVTPGETLTIYVGGQSVGLPLSGGPGGFNGGGNGGFDNVNNDAPGAGGGGASDVRQGVDSLANRVVVAGGGGGAECCTDANGGDGGGLIGATGGTSGGGSNPGGGGTQTEGGAGGGGCNGNGGDGALLQGGGGGNGNRAGGGGGGGYYGGGGGGGCVLGSGGGGGSSYSAGTNTIHTQGYQTDAGQVVITVSAPGSPPISSTFGPPSSSNPSGTFAEPVNTATGNYFFQRTDLAIPGRGLPLAFTRTYNSLDPYSGPLGAGWTHSYNLLLTENLDGSVTIKQGEGQDEVYDPAGGGNYTPRFAGVFNVLVKHPDGSFALTLKNQTENQWNAGNLTSSTDRNGNAILFSYDGSGRLATITDTVGRAVTLAYDASNRISQLTDPIGRTVLYSYDGDGNLASATDQAAGIMTFSYDASHRVTNIQDQRGAQLLTNTYDNSGRVATQANGRGFTTAFAYGTPNPGDTTIIDPRSNATIHTHDAQFRLIRVTEANASTQDFTYDAQNNRTSSKNQNGNTTSFAYDSRGNLTSLADPLGHSSSFSYDAMNDLLTATNARGLTTTFAYDVKGNLTTVADALANTTTFAYDSFGQLLSKTDARGGVTAFLYDTSGNLTRITDPLGKKTNLAYDAVGRLTSITDPNSHAATATYDSLNRLKIAKDALGNQTKFAYDAVGNLLKITDARGKATNYAYDATSNLTSVTDALAHVTSYAYDENNNRTSFTNAKGNAASYTFDVVNRLNAVTDPLSLVTSYSYDGVGNAVSLTDAKGQLNEFAYDAVNRLTDIAYADSSNVTYSYDENGNRTAMVDSSGTTSYSYDALDRVTSVVQPGGGTVAYTYDAVSNRKSTAYPDGKVVNYTYDAANRLSQAADWLSRAASYTYDPASNLTKTTYSTGAGMSFTYDAANRLTKLVNTFKNVPSVPFAYTLDAVGNRTKLSVLGVTTTYSYDALSELVSAKLGPLTSTWTYDAVGNRTKQVSPFGTVNYTYDVADRLLTAGSTTFTYDANGSRVSKTTGGTTLAYAYDAANRLTAVTGGSTSSSFAYDGDGNRVSQTVGAGTYNYVNDVASALPVALQESGPDGNISYAYGLGLISESGPSFNYFYQYDGLGSVIALTNSSGNPAGAYLYDAWGNSLAFPGNIGTKNKFRFTGEALDPGTGLYFLRARYYDPAPGRFVSRDPFSGFLLSPATLNRYAYAQNNPAVLTDHTGLTAIRDTQASQPLGPSAAVRSTTPMAPPIGLEDVKEWTESNRRYEPPPPSIGADYRVAFVRFLAFLLEPLVKATIMPLTAFAPQEFSREEALRDLSYRCYPSYETHGFTFISKSPYCGL